ncbi:MAG: HEAT repeat domain-containing protein [Opitutaceae bacterium]
MKFIKHKSTVVLRDAEIVPELIDASNDADPQMRDAVARCLGAIGSDEAVERLIEMADDDEIEEAVWIALGDAKNSKAIPKLEEELASHLSQRARSQLLITLADCGDRTRLYDLVEVMENSDFQGHVHSANRIFEEIAGRKFYKVPYGVRAWLHKSEFAKK